MSGRASAEEFTVSETEQERLAYALSTAQTHFNLYQREVSVNYAWYVALSVTTMVGSAMTPLLALLLENKFWIALPSGVAGIAAAVNSALRLKEEWRDNYVTLSALDVELDKFKGRAAPDYGLDKPLSQAIDQFQAKVSGIVLSDVKAWKQQMTKPTKGGR